MSLDFMATRTEGFCKCCGREPEYILDVNITHNLNTMAEEAGLYKALWRPDEQGWKQLKDIIPILEKGLKDLKDRPEHYKTFNPENGWGTYKYFVYFVEKILECGRENSEAFIEINR